MQSPETQIDVFYTIESVHRDEIKVKGSRFIASVSPVESKQAAAEFHEKIRNEFHDATHNCFAYSLGFKGLEFRYSDDGEPSGSAGKPILFSIKKFGYSDIIVVVTRYYGGTKLGVGGLARAYSEAANLVLEKCTAKPVFRKSKVIVYCIYEDISVVKKIIDDMAISFTDHYADSIEFVVEVPLSKTDAFVSKITSVTKGRAGTIIKK